MMYGGAAGDNTVTSDILNRSGDANILMLAKTNAKYQTMTHLSRSAIASSTRRLPAKNN